MVTMYEVQSRERIDEGKVLKKNPATDGGWRKRSTDEKSAANNANRRQNREGER